MTIAEYMNATWGNTKKALCSTEKKTCILFTIYDIILFVDLFKEGGVADMSRRCEVCGKGQVSGNNVSHSNRHTRRKWNANIQTVRVDEKGTVRRANVCTRCLRSGKINRAI